MALQFDINARCTTLHGVADAIASHFARRENHNSAL